MVNCKGRSQSARAIFIGAAEGGGNPENTAREGRNGAFEEVLHDDTVRIRACGWFSVEGEGYRYQTIEEALTRIKYLEIIWLIGVYHHVSSAYDLV